MSPRSCSSRINRDRFDARRSTASISSCPHTHGGQIWPWHYLVKIQQGGLLAGRYEFEHTQLHVSRGCGYWGPCACSHHSRSLAPLEITRVILRSGTGAAS